MQRGSVFWGVVLVAAGAFFLVGNLFQIDAWKLVGPGLLILFGVWVLWGATMAPRAAAVQNLSIPSQGAAQGRLILRHGAGVLRLGAGAAPDELAAGEFVGGVTQSTRRDGDTLQVDLRVPPENMFLLGAPWAWRRGFAWTLRLSEALPLSLRLEFGAGEADIDLTALKVNDVQISTGASSTILRLPAHAGSTRARIESGVASVRILVPQGVAASISATGGLADQRIDKARFPRTGARYQSPDYETAPNKVEIHVQTGVGSVEVR